MRFYDNPTTNPIESNWILKFQNQSNPIEVGYPIFIGRFVIGLDSFELLIGLVFFAPLIVISNFSIMPPD